MILFYITLCGLVAFVLLWNSDFFSCVSGILILAKLCSLMEHWFWKLSVTGLKLCWPLCCVYDLAILEVFFLCPFIPTTFLFRFLHFCKMMNLHNKILSFWPRLVLPYLNAMWSPNVKSNVVLFKIKWKIELSPKPPPPFVLSGSILYNGLWI